MLDDEVVSLPVYEYRLGNEIQRALINARHLPALTSLDLHYWFIGDKRAAQPILRRTISAVDQFGKFKGVNLALHRVIATAIRLGQMPSDFQTLYDQSLATPAVKLSTVLAPNGMYDFRDQNIASTNRQKGRAAKIQKITPSIAVTPEEMFSRQKQDAADLRRQAIESLGMTEAEFDSLAAPGDELADLEAKRGAIEDQKSLIDTIKGFTEKAVEQQKEAEQKGERQ